MNFKLFILYNYDKKLRSISAIGIGKHPEITFILGMQLSEDIESEKKRLLGDRYSERGQL